MIKAVFRIMCLRLDRLRGLNRPTPVEPVEAVTAARPIRRSKYQEV
jgi:hypothetical protein